MKKHGWLGVWVAFAGIGLSMAGNATAEDDSIVRFSLLMSNRFVWKGNALDTLGSLTDTAATNAWSRLLANMAGLDAQNAQANEADPLNLRFNQDELVYSVFLGLVVDVRLHRRFTLHLGLDSGELRLPALAHYDPGLACTGKAPDYRCEPTSNGRPIETAARESLFLREAYLEGKWGPFGWIRVKAGKLLVSTANGFVLDNYALGVSASADLDTGYDLPWKLTVDALFPDGTFTAAGKKSPFAYVDLAYRRSFLEEIGFFFGWYHDGDNNIGDILWSIFNEELLAIDPSGYATNVAVTPLGSGMVKSQADLFWLGLRGNWLRNRLALSFTAILEFGSADLTYQGDWLARKGEVDFLGGAADALVQWDVLDSLTLGSFLVFMSGETYQGGNETKFLNRRYQTFVSVYPYLTYTNIFFSGGMNENYSARSFSSSGINGRGVIAPGLTAGWEVGKALVLRAVSALLFSHGAHVTSNRRFYGWETDLNADWEIWDHVRLLLEADYLWTGDFFDFKKPLTSLSQNQTLTQEPGCFKLMAGLELRM